MHSTKSVRRRLAGAAIALAVAAARIAPAAAQPTLHLPLSSSPPTGDSVIARIYDEGMRRSQAYPLAQTLMDSIGPRLTGSPANRAANDWLVRTYASWGVGARNEKYGTWRDWARGQSRVELLAPRARTLEATMLAWSPATPAGGVTGEVVMLPPTAESRDSAGFARWLGTVRGKLVLVSYPQPTCRPDSDYGAWAPPATVAAVKAARDSGAAEFRRRVTVGGYNTRTLLPALEAAGAAAVLGNTWSRGWGVDKIFAARTARVPTFDVSCEDYGLLARLAERGQHPRAHAVAEATSAPNEAPVYNTIAEVKGSALPNEYVMLSAHLDSWDGASGATDNGTGTIIMLEAMRILKQVYPHPKRTILVGHWSGEEEGDIGSGAFAADHPEVLAGLQALFNQDNGAGEIDTVQTNGFVDAAAHFARWMSRMPADVTRTTVLALPGIAHDESTDSDAFDCRDAPGFFLTSSDWSYGDYTWHTNRDTFDKIDFATIRRNATLVAMLAYEASEDPERVSRARRVPPVDAESGRTVAPPRCGTPPRSFAETLTRGGR
ncbi:peptidase M28 (plasmid) [Gemmatirosa kalamazoonensis]|uniref:Carboxypeptidase Q n=1 Tax=Gemmatirosa kalamazoonensis TaxID=861299 RepID=W0RUV4_9BACT|nr:M28 family peptidase [Gemmatirosa kalamazoonensis]AHG93363.1 peptidase M28 [Gemmatirosa kalamazoonensis]